MAIGRKIPQECEKNSRLTHIHCGKNMSYFKNKFPDTHQSVTFIPKPKTRQSSFPESILLNLTMAFGIIGMSIVLLFRKCQEILF